MSKTCGLCNSTKEFIYYNKAKNTSGYQNYCKDCQSVKNKQWNIQNKHRRNQTKKQFRLKHLNKFRKQHNEYIAKRKKLDPSYKIAHNLRNRLTRSLKENHKQGKTLDYLGCTIEFFKMYLQSWFYTREDGTLMTWENYGQWHIDHLKPLSLFDLSKDEEIKKAMYYKNLQPLWSEDNLEKKDYISPIALWAIENLPNDPEDDGFCTLNNLKVSGVRKQ